MADYPYYNGYRDAVHGALVQQRHMDIISNNLANLNTPGFKSDRLIFNDYMTREIQTFHDQGSLKVTDNPLDVAIGGDGYFQIKMPDGETRLTRSGSFHMTTQGALVDAMGRTVLDENKAPINLNPEGGKIFIDSEGGVNQGNERVGALGVVTVKDKNILQKQGANTFLAKEGKQLQTVPATDYTITQGALEASNVVVVREMVGMINAFRAFESYQKAIHTMGEIDSKAANQVGRVG
ncbi:flagellar hook-basal body protein [Dethiosulfatarculus sandiegensis]|uniref:Uncharacterized protein n=1 Tax=Dethiosulfatarculus sandiegensis TaxID=1429043 RepID=A0A0D2J611_9BACT|nr:flagellar hook-basal body protein [Dethiosulfatarculus sandiegensis]KIX13529.1 hypothetical protein X474_13670 [Dethiosulfatarculus sandiegensis]